MVGRRWTLVSLGGTGGVLLGVGFVAICGERCRDEDEGGWCNIKLVESRD